MTTGENMEDLPNGRVFILNVYFFGVRDFLFRENLWKKKKKQTYKCGAAFAEKAINLDENHRKRKKGTSCALFKKVETNRLRQMCIW